MSLEVSVKYTSTSALASAGCESKQKKSSSLLALPETLHVW